MTELFKTMDAWFINLLAVAGCGFFLWYIKRKVTTDYRTQEQCEECSVRASMEVIKALVIELAIKAGVPAHEVAKIASVTGKKE
jgi:hypothetical protein